MRGTAVAAAADDRLREHAVRVLASGAQAGVPYVGRDAAAIAALAALSAHHDQVVPRHGGADLGEDDADDRAVVRHIAAGSPAAADGLRHHGGSGGHLVGIGVAAVRALWVDG